MPVIDLGRVIGPQGPQGEVGAQGIRGEQGLPGPNQVTNSTATPLTGVLTGNGSVVGVESIDAAPTADSTGFARSGGTDKAIKGRVPVYGKGVNLLRNWYFVGGGTGHGVFPVNQRGQSSYSDGTYVFDGWSRSSYATLSLSENGAGLSIKSGGTVATIYQSLAGKAPLGQNITMAVFTSIGLIVQTGQVPSTLPSSNTTILTIGSSETGYRMRAYLRPAGNIYVEINAYTEYTMQAVKLELGTEQTLCHNEGTDANPVWVLNEVPDYEYELYRCITSTADSSDTYANKTLATGQEIAYVENGTTATKTNGYVVGEYFCWHGLLYRAKTAIGNGDTFTENTNCEKVTEGGLNNVGSIDISSYISVNQSRLNNAKIKARYYPGSKKVELQAEGAVSTSLSAAQNTLFTVASPYAPSSGVQQFTGCGIKNSQTPIAVWANSAAINAQHGGASVGDAIAISLSWLLV